MKKALSKHFTPAELNAALEYDAGTGILYRLTDSGRGMQIKTVTPYGYLQVAFGGRCMLVHRVVWAMHFGEWPSGMIDHINRVKTDNRICNLRIANNVQNAGNMSVHSRSKSGVKGVSQKPNGRWRAYIRFNGKNHALGTFINIQDAINAYNKAAHEVHGDFALPPKDNSLC